MKGFLFLTLLFMSFNSFARLEQAPPNFKYGTSKAVFVDFHKAHYQLDFSNFSWRSRATTNIDFFMPEDGHPIFDSVNTPISIYLDGELTSQELINSPDKATKFRVVKKFIPKGNHSLTITTKMKNGVWGSFIGVSSGFFIRDLQGRRFLEKFVPSNLEYDQYKMIFDVTVRQTIWRHRVFANGKVKRTGRNSFHIEFPEYYTASSIYFHLAPSRKFKVTKFYYNSVDGRKVPVTIYSLFWLRNWHFKKKAIRVLHELERDYGPYPHSELLVYATKLMGGMEYTAAVETSYISLGHELQHMYFAKGVMPANGNSGWMDEGIASWRDKGHQEHKQPNYLAFNLGNHSLYQRKTDKNSYVKGRSFIAYLDYKLREMGLPGMKNFLRGYQQKRMHTTVTTEDFIKDLQVYSGSNFRSDFDRYIFGKHPENMLDGRSPAVEPINPHHPDISEQELNSIL